LRSGKQKHATACITPEKLKDEAPSRVNNQVDWEQRNIWPAAFGLDDQESYQRHETEDSFKQLDRDPHPTCKHNSIAATR